MVSGFPSVPVVSHPGHQRLVSSAGAFFAHWSESYFVFGGEAALFHSDGDLRVGSAFRERANLTIERRGRKGRKERQSSLAAFAAFAFHGAVSYSDNLLKGGFFHACVMSSCERITPGGCDEWIPRFR